MVARTRPTPKTASVRKTLRRNDVDLVGGLAGVAGDQHVVLMIRAEVDGQAEDPERLVVGPGQRAGGHAVDVVALGRPW